MLDVELPGGVKTRLPRLPIEVDSHDFNLRRQPPAVGQHSRELLLECGLSDAEIDDLRDRGIIVAQGGAAGD